MIELDVPVPAEADLAHLEEIVETVCAGASLRRALKGTLASYTGSVHWHYAQARQRGILEITWWPARRRLWFKVSAGRSAPWIAARLPQLQQSLETALHAGMPVPARPTDSPH
jgi:hypothetical protein